MAGFELDTIHYIGCYAPDSKKAVILIERCRQYLLDHPAVNVVFVGDFNTHNAEWLVSNVKTDGAGIAAQELCESFNLHQLVGFSYTW